MLWAVLVCNTVLQSIFVNDIDLNSGLPMIQACLVVSLPQMPNSHKKLITDDELAEVITDVSQLNLRRESVCFSVCLSVCLSVCGHDQQTHKLNTRDFVSFVFRAFAFTKWNIFVHIFCPVSRLVD
jgi:hypothetical protein